MDLGLWIAQAGLAIAFLIHGWGMLTAPEHLRQRMGYIFELAPALRSGIGGAEVAGAGGLLLPGLTGMMPILTPLAALGLAIIMLGAILFHVRRREFINTGLNLFLLILSLVIAYSRWFLVPLG